MPYQLRHGLGGQYDAYLPQMNAIIGSSTGEAAVTLLQNWGDTQPCPAVSEYNDVIAAFNESSVLLNGGIQMDMDPLPCGYNPNNALLSTNIPVAATSTNVGAPGGGVAPAAAVVAPSPAPVAAPLPAVPSLPSGSTVTTSNAAGSAPSGTAASTDWFTEDSWGSIPNWVWLLAAAGLGWWWMER
jgi:hypothetical protein